MHCSCCMRAGTDRPRSRRSVLLVALLVGLLSVSTGDCGVDGRENPWTSAGFSHLFANALQVPLSPIADKPVTSWSVSDVEYWMNNTIGYPEYSPYIRKHRVDGPTLLILQPPDFEEHFPVQNSIHVLKLKAHVALLQGLCTCGNEAERLGGVVTFWGWYLQNNYRGWILGWLSLFFPRAAMGYVYLFDSEIYDLLTGSPVPQSELLSQTESVSAKSATIPKFRVTSLFSAVNYFLAFIAFPDLYMAYQTSRIIFTNYLLMPFMLVHFLGQGMSEYLLMYMMYKNTAFDPSTTLQQRIWHVFSYSIFVPPVAAVISPVVPILVQKLLMAAMCAYVVVSVVGVAILLLGGSETAAESENSSSEKKSQ